MQKLTCFSIPYSVTTLKAVGHS